VGIPTSTTTARGKGFRVNVTTTNLSKLQSRLGEIGSAASDLRYHKDAIIGEIQRQYRVGRRYINRTGRLSLSLLSTRSRDNNTEISKNRIVYESRVPYAQYVFRRGYINRISRKGIKDAIVTSLRGTIQRGGRRGTGRR
jgi:hypothetical protein